MGTPDLFYYITKAFSLNELKSTPYDKYYATSSFSHSSISFSICVCNASSKLVNLLLHRVFFLSRIIRNWNTQIKNQNKTKITKRKKKTKTKEKKTKHIFPKGKAIISILIIIPLFIPTNNADWQSGAKKQLTKH